MYINDFILENMVVIPKGQEIIRDYIDKDKWISSNYKMSNPGTKKPHRVIEKNEFIDSFLLMKTPVTVELYNSILGIEYDDKLKKYPVVNVSWIEAIRFCNILSEKFALEKCYVLNQKSEKIIYDDLKNGFRLPTDAQWQYACRANSKGYRYADIDSIAWFDKNSKGELQEVKQKKENEFGLFDMIGNIWEWCWDIYDEERYGNYRIFRGGSFASEERACGATSRRKSFPEFKIDDLGFRLAINYMEVI